MEMKKITMDNIEAVMSAMHAAVNLDWLSTDSRRCCLIATTTFQT